MKHILKYACALALTVCTISSQAQETVFEGLKDINGTKLYCKVVGKGEPILVIHGGPGFGYDYFLPYLMQLAKEHTLIFYDQRSTCKSAIPADSLGASHKNMIDDIDALRKAFNLKKLNILAHSWGAKLAVNYALLHPASVKSIIFSDPVAMNHQYDSLQMKMLDKKKFSPGFIDKKNEIQAREISIIEIKMRFSFLGSSYSPETADKVSLCFPEDFADKQRSLFAGLSSDWKLYDRDLYADMKNITCPALVIHGDADAMPLEADERFTSSLGKAQMVRLEKSGHFPFIEEPERFTQVINDFLKTVK